MVPTDQARARLSIDVPRDVRRRIRLAAAQRDQSIREYVCEAVEARLREDLAGDSSALTTLTAETDPVLAALWDNPKDAAYDNL